MAVGYRKSRLIRNFLIVLVVLICFSRNYLGVHTPQDVLVSSVIGLLLLWITFHLKKWLDERAGRECWVLIFSAAMCVFMILYASLKSYPMDYVDGELLVDPKKMALDSWKSGGEILGFGIAWFCEHKWVKFSVEGSVSERLGRFLVGGIFVILLFYVTTPALKLFLPVQIANFCERFFMALFVVLLYPMYIARRKAKRAGA